MKVFITNSKNVIKNTVDQKHKQILKHWYSFNYTFKNKFAVLQIFWKIDTRPLMTNLIIQVTISAKKHSILHSIAPSMIVKFNPEYTLRWRQRRIRSDALNTMRL